MVLLRAAVAEGLLFAIGGTFPKWIAAQKRIDNAISSQGRAIENNNKHRKMNDDQRLSHIFAELR